MKYVFFALVSIICGSVMAGEPVSVLNHGAAAAAAPSVAAAAPAASEVVVVESQPARQIVIVEGAPGRCVNGRCSTSAQSICTGPNCQKYSVKEDATETVRKRWFGGGVVIRNNARTVVAPVR